MKKHYKNQKRKNKSGKWRKTNFLHIVPAALLGLWVINLSFSKWSLTDSLKLLGLEIAVILGSFALIVAIGNRLKVKSSKNIRQKTYNGSINLPEIDHTHNRTKYDSHRVRKLEKRNFNWVLDDKPAVPKADNKSEAPKQEAKKEVFIPYRSPFDPIKPAAVKETKQEKEECAEQKMHIVHAIPVETDNITEASEEVTVCQEMEAENKAFEECTPEAEPEYVIHDVKPYRIYDFEKLKPYENEETHMSAEQEAFEEAEQFNNLHETDIEDSLDAEDEFDESSIFENDMDTEDTEDILPDNEFYEYEDEEALSFRTGQDISANEPEAPIEQEEAETDLPAAVVNVAREEILPPVELLNRSCDDSEEEEKLEMSHAEQNAKKLIDTLASFGVGARVTNISEGPSVTRYEIQPNVGVKVSKIVNLADDIALNLAATGVRIEAPIPGKAAVGIEVPNREVKPVFLRDVIESEEFMGHSSKLAFAVGKDIAGNNVVADIAKMPHLLIAGATGSGKSVCINTLIASILYKALPSEVKLLMVDPKVVELSIYNGIPHLLIPVVTDPKKAAGALNWAVIEMTNRYKLFADNNVRDLKGYNSLLREKGGQNLLPQIVIIIDELADLMMAAPNDVEDCICRLAQMARAAGMHLVIATQRPSVDVITGVIKANIPSRISFAVSSQIDSRTILDMAGAEKLLGRGDMLFSPIGLSKPVRVQGGFISDKEVEAIVTSLKAGMEAQYDEDILNKIEKSTEAPQAEQGSNDDELLPQAVELVIELGQASTSMIQRKFKVGYSRAARIIDQMESWGIVGQFDGSKPRQVLITRQEWEELRSEFKYNT